jgi:hypothetical protein
MAPPGAPPARPPATGLHPDRYRTQICRDGLDCDRRVSAAPRRAAGSSRGHVTLQPFLRAPCASRAAQQAIGGCGARRSRRLDTKGHTPTRAHTPRAPPHP